MRTASNLNAPPFLSFSESWTSFCQKLLLFFYLGKEKCGKVFVFSSCASTYDVVLNYIVSSMPKEEMCGSRITMVKRTSLFAFHTLSIIPFWMHVLPYIKKKYILTSQRKSQRLHYEFWVQNNFFHQKGFKNSLKY